MNKPVLSFIIAVYNGELYLRDCLEHLYMQDANLDEYEVICIDDCSTDKSLTILNEYAAKYSNLCIVEHKTNKGANISYYEGRCVAQGKYLWHHDQDDFIEPNCLGYLLKKLTEENLDVLCFNYHRVNAKGTIVDKPIVFQDVSIMNGREYLYSYWIDTFQYYLLGYMWRCITTKEIFMENVSIPAEGTNWGDTTPLFKCVYAAQRVATTKKAFYNYRINELSVSGSASQYTAKTIFEFAFLIGKEVLDYGLSIKEDEILSQKFINIAKTYFNSFILKVIVAPYAEKRKFYTLVRQNKDMVESLLKLTSWKVRLFAHPIVGIVITSIMKPLYLLKRRLQGKAI